MNYREPNLLGKWHRLLRFWDNALIVLFAGGLIQAFLFRAAYIDSTFGLESSCEGCYTYSLFAHDIAYLSVLFLIFIASFLIRRFRFYIGLRIVALLGLLIYVADVVTMQQFFTRLKLGDVRLYGDQLDLVWRHISNTGLMTQSSWLLAFAIIVSMVIILLPPRAGIRSRSVWILIVVPLIGITMGFMLKPASYVQDWALENIVEANKTPGVATAYSAEKIATVISVNQDKEQVCQQGGHGKKDIVLLILESWSPYQSQFWSGNQNWTPKLDKLARENTAYTQLHAGGFATNEGLISLLSGIEYLAPTKPFFAIWPFETAWNTTETLPKVLKQEGYHTSFLTSGNLNFSSKGKWMNNIGFDTIEGHDQPDYDGHKRLHFDAVPDEILYQHAAKYIAEKQNNPRPFFVTIENVSTHHPYIHPVSREKGAESVFRYMDDTVDVFYQQLVDQGFFDQGMLIIVSDHRAMVPITAEEQNQLGRAAASRIPMIMINSPAPAGKIEVIAHQNDLLPTLKAYSRQQACGTSAYRNLFEPDKTVARCVFHARGDDRDHIDVFCDEGEGVIELAGDETYFISHNGLSDTRQNILLNEVNQHRILGDIRQQAFQQTRKQ